MGIMKEEIPWKPLIPVDVQNDLAFKFELPREPSRFRLTRSVPLTILVSSPQCHVLSYKDKPWPKAKGYPPSPSMFNLNLAFENSEQCKRKLPNDFDTLSEVDFPLDKSPESYSSPYTPTDVFSCSLGESFLKKTEEILAQNSSRLLRNKINFLNLLEDDRVMCFASDMKQRRGSWNTFWEGRKTVPLNRLCIFYFEKSCIECHEHFTIKKKLDTADTTRNNEENNNNLFNFKPPLTSESKKECEDGNIYFEEIRNITTVEDYSNEGNSVIEPSNKAEGKTFKSWLPSPLEEISTSKSDPLPEDNVCNLPLPKTSEESNNCEGSLGPQSSLQNVDSPTATQYQLLFLPYVLETSNCQQNNYSEGYGTHDDQYFLCLPYHHAPLPVPPPSALSQPVPPPSALSQPVPPPSVLPRPVPPPSVLPRPVPYPSVLRQPVPPSSVLPRPVPPLSVLPRPVPSPSVLSQSVSHLQVPPSSGPPPSMLPPHVPPLSALPQPHSSSSNNSSYFCTYY